MRIEYMGRAGYRKPIRTIHWICDCGTTNIARGAWSRRLRCNKCARVFDVEIHQLPDPAIGGPTGPHDNTD